MSLKDTRSHPATMPLSRATKKTAMTIIGWNPRKPKCFRYHLLGKFGRYWIMQSRKIPRSIWGRERQSFGLSTRFSCNESRFTLSAWSRRTGYYSGLFILIFLDWFTSSESFGLHIDLKTLWLNSCRHFGSETLPWVWVQLKIWSRAWSFFIGTFPRIFDASSLILSLAKTILPELTFTPENYTKILSKANLSMTELDIFVELFMK